MLLRQLFEEINKTAVLGWGRGMGHKGHMLLAKAVLHHAQEIDAKAYFVVSRTSLVDPATGQPWADRPTFTKTKDDPLSPEEKLATYRKVFPQNADVFSVATADASTLDKVLVKIARDGFSKVILIVGELEKDSFSFLTRPDKSGIPPYQKAGLRDLEIISRQDTSEPSSVKGSPDYQEGPRATPMRTVLTDPSKSEEEQFAVWRDAMPDNLSDDEVMDLMNKAKQRMAAVPAAKNAKKAKQAVAEGVNDYLWHGSKTEHSVLYPQQANDTGGKQESNKNAIYATPSARVAIAMGLTTPGSDTGMFPNDPQMVLFKGQIRKGQMVYLHKVPKDLFIKHNGREWYSKPDVKEISIPNENIIAVPVDKYLNLIRQATPQDLELQKKYMKQGRPDTNL